MAKPDTFAQRLQALRLKAGLTQTQLAEATGLSLGSIRNYEQEHREPQWDALFALAKALGVDCSAFVDCVSKDSVKKPPAKKGKGRKKGG